MADTKLPALTETSVPALDDVVYTVDVSDTTDDATGSSRKLTLARQLGLVNSLCCGRLTLTSGTAVTTADVTGATNVYFTPCGGNSVTLYDGTRWKLYAFTEITLALGTLTSGKNYDVFLYDNSGTLTLESLAWTSDSARATALVLQDGVYVKTGATTRRYLGTFRTTSTTQTEDSAANRFLWNAYNRRRRIMVAPTETTDSWAYTTATWRSANASTSNRVQFVAGLAEETVRATVAAHVTRTVVEGVGCGIGVNSTTATESQVVGVVCSR